MVQVAPDACQLEVRIGAGIAMAGKMLGGGQHASIAGGADVSCGEFAYLLRIFTERPRIDDWVRRIRVDVGNGREIPLDSNGAGFLSDNLREGGDRGWI